MGELKTKKNDASVQDAIDAVENETRREDAKVLLELFTKTTGQPAMMWGTSIIGFGQYHYKSERSSQEGDWPLVAFSPRKQNLTLYVIMPDFPELDTLLGRLGKYKTSKGCLYINKLADIDGAVLEEIIRAAYLEAKKRLTQG